MFFGVDNYETCMIWLKTCFVLQDFSCLDVCVVASTVEVCSSFFENLVDFLQSVSIVWLDDFQFPFSRWREPDVKFVLDMFLEKQDL